jgi:hypothetical protein
MSHECRRDVGLTRRELEREAQWLMRHLPTDPAQLTRLMTQLVVTLIEKNNAALARRIEPPDDGGPGAS